MGGVWDIYEFNEIKQQYNSFPMFICVPFEMIKSEVHNYKYIPLGQQLSFNLRKYNPEYRSAVIEKELEKLLSKVDSKNIYIKDIDILFNPEYRLHIIRLFIQLSKNINLIIQWPGEYKEGSLIYSKPEYVDYKNYPIKDYDIICLK